MGLNPTGLVLLRKGLRGKATWRLREKVVVSKLKRRLQEGQPAHTLIVGLQPPDPGEQCLWFKPPACGTLLWQLY